MCGCATKNIVYNVPMKSLETFIEALTGWAIVNIKTKRKLDWMPLLPQGREYAVVMRININISEISPDDAEGEDDNSRLGLSEERGELSMAVKRIQAIPGISLSGLHITLHSSFPSPPFLTNGR